MIHNAECHIKANVNPQENVLYREVGVSLADINRIFPNWEQRMQHFIDARHPILKGMSDNPVFKEAFILGLTYAVEQIIQTKQ